MLGYYSHRGLHVFGLGLLVFRSGSHSEMLAPIAGAARVLNLMLAGYFLRRRSNPSQFPRLCCGGLWADLFEYMFCFFGFITNERVWIK